MPAPKPRRRPQAGVRTFRAIRPGSGIEAAYRKRLQQLLERVHASVMWWIAAEYKKHPPALAQDASPFTFIRRLVNKVRDRWLKSIEQTAPKLAAYFATSVQKRVDTDLKKILKEGGFAVEVRPTKAMQDVQAASIEENVSLIKSIPEQYLGQVEQAVARVYANGHDLKQLTDELQKRFKVSKKRAAFIARDQSSKLTSQVNRIRSIENGLTVARWAHSRAGRVPRPTHLHLMNGQEFDLREGLFDPDPKVNRKVFPGELINCRCIARTVIPDITRLNARGIEKEKYDERLSKWKEEHNS